MPTTPPSPNTARAPHDPSALRALSPPVRMATNWIAQADLGRAVKWVRRALTPVFVATARQRRRSWELFVQPHGDIEAAFRDWRDRQRNYVARVVVELARNSRVSPSEAAQRPVHGLEVLERARQRGRGILALCGHLGPWWHCGAALSARGYRGVAVFDPSAPGGAGECMIRHFESFGGEVAPVGQRAGAAIRKALRERRGALVLLDSVPRDRHAKWLPFGPTEMRISLGAVRIALHHGAAIVHLTNHFVDDPDAWPEMGVREIRGLDWDSPPDAETIGRLWLRELAEDVAARPEQWFLWRYHQLRPLGQARPEASA